MSQQQLHSAIRSSRFWAGIRQRRILLALAAFLAAIALTYVWNAVGAAMLLFGVRAALSALLVFFGAFLLADLWLPFTLDDLSAIAPATDGERLTDDAEGAPEHLPHLPVPATDFPRLLFDTNEYPALSASQKDAKKPGGPPRRSPLAWPHHITPEE